MDEKKNMVSSMESLIKGMETFLSSKTVVGEPIELGDAIILPLVDVSFGCASGAAAGLRRPVYPAAPARAVRPDGLSGGAAVLSDHLPGRAQRRGGGAAAP